jgi:hypothetical protein
MKKLSLVAGLALLAGCAAADVRPVLGVEAFTEKAVYAPGEPITFGEVEPVGIFTNSFEVRHPED